MTRIIAIVLLSLSASGAVDIVLGNRSAKTYSGTGLTRVAQWGAQIVYSPETDFGYSLADGNATITNYTGAGGVVRIPPTLAGHPVVAIVDYCPGFRFHAAITGVEFPASITSIGHEMLNGSGTRYAVFGAESYTYLGHWIFHGCSMTALYFSHDYTSPQLTYSMAKCGSPAIYRKPGTTGWPATVDLYDRTAVPVQEWTSYPNQMP